MNPSDQHVAFLALGSNLGDRLANLRAAIQGLTAKPGIALDGDRAVARVYETAPVGMAKDTPAFLNTAVRFRTHLSPRELLRVALAVEESLGRVRDATGSVGNGQEARSRTIDIDLLLYDHCVANEADLILPHPRLHARQFVLEPLAEIGADIQHPVSKVDVAQLARLMREGHARCQLDAVAEFGWECVDRTVTSP